VLLLIRPVKAQSACDPNSPQLIIYHAGSLTAVFSQVEKIFTQQTAICVTDAAAGSLDAARRITVGQEPCYIYASADYKDIDVLLKPRAMQTIIFYLPKVEWSCHTTSSKQADTIAAPGVTFDPASRLMPKSRLVYATDTDRNNNRGFSSVSRSERVPGRPDSADRSALWSSNLYETLGALQHQQIHRRFG
jgi:hypothetical protein